ncbi:MAG: ribonuclease T2 [Methylobacteriaceae bacterium]|nr:ribonuclease T2 [Methylobacteriaceae bacterium]
MIRLLTAAVVAAGTLAFSGAHPGCMSSSTAQVRQPSSDFQNRPQPRRDDRRPSPANNASRRDFTYYVLSLSWSRGFCADSRNSSRSQCARALGFVVHGLWPQYERGFPSDCATRTADPSFRDMETVKDVFPDTGLARYEWRKHGTCTGLAPAEYFRTVRAAYDRVTIPDVLTKPGVQRTLTVQQIKQAFSRANPGLLSNMTAVQCDRGILQEVRVCLEKNLRSFRRCGDDVRDRCSFGPVTLVP